MMPWIIFCQYLWLLWRCTPRGTVNKLCCEHHHYSQLCIAVIIWMKVKVLIMKGSNFTVDIFSVDMTCINTKNKMVVLVFLVWTCRLEHVNVFTLILKYSEIFLLMKMILNRSRITELQRVHACGIVSYCELYRRAPWVYYLIFVEMYCWRNADFQRSRIFSDFDIFSTLCIKSWLVFLLVSHASCDAIHRLASHETVYIVS